MMRQGRGNTEAIPLYTALTPTKWRVQGAADVARELVLDVMKTQNIGPRAAVEQLVSKGELGAAEKLHRAGKLLRGDHNYITDRASQYDGLIMPGFSDQEMRLRGMDAPSKTPTAPSSITYLDLDRANKSMNDSEVSPDAIKFVRNYGNSGRGQERLQIKPYIELSANNGAYDVTSRYPLTQQLLNRDVMERRRTR